MFKKVTVMMMVLSLAAPAFAGAPRDAQEKGEQVRKAAAESLAAVKSMSWEKFVAEAQSIRAQAIKRGDTLLAEKIDAMMESPKMKDALVNDIQAQLNDMQENGFFLLGVAICHMVAAINGGGWCFNPGRPGYVAGGIGCAAFFILTVATLGSDQAASDF